MGYIVIQAMEKGVSIREYSREEFEEEAAKGDDGYIGKNPKFISNLSKALYSDDLRGRDTIVIKGEVVVPKAVKVVKTFSLEDVD